MATQRDIAEHLGLSISTVSLALRNAPRISRETKQLVRDTADRLGYQLPALSTMEVKQIAFITQFGLDNPFFPGVLAGAEYASRARGIMLHYSRVETPTELSMAQYAKMDALLVAGPLDYHILDQLLGLRVPLVFVESYVPALDADCVLVENVHSMNRIVAQLMAWGHRRIAFVNGPSHTTSFRERRWGYYMAMVESGQQPIELCCTSGDSVSSERVVDEWLATDSATGVTAIIGCNDEVTIGALHAVQRRGLRVPQDISLVGFDDVDIASKVRPQLTTCHTPRDLLGLLGVQQLIERATNPDGPRLLTLVEPTLIIRDSVHRFST